MEIKKIQGEETFQINGLTRENLRFLSQGVNLLEDEGFDTEIWELKKVLLEHLYPGEYVFPE